MMKPCWQARIASACLAVIAGGSLAGEASIACHDCEEWNRDQAPVHLQGGSWYVGPHGLASILIDTGDGLVLVDGALPQSAPGILRRIRQLGFDPRRVKWILNTHAHFDHAGGIAALQSATGAMVLASRESAAVLRSGTVAADDPQAGTLPGFPAVARVRTFEPGAVLHLGHLELHSLPTGGHTHGGTSWAWQACERGRCLQLVYADSLGAASSSGYRYSDPGHLPRATREFESAFRALESVRCDLLVTPHPEASGFWERVDRLAADASALVDPGACRTYARSARAAWQQRLAAERR